MKCSVLAVLGCFFAMAGRILAAEPLSPEETRKMIQVPPGFEVRLFAAEPLVVNPSAMTWDERGRLWVIERGANRDRIKILEDGDGDGRAEKATVFAEGFFRAGGIALGNGGVYLGTATNLYFVEDTNGDEKADKNTILKTGFCTEQREGLFQSFAWGPDGWLYMTHSGNTPCKVTDPSTVNDDGVTIQGGLVRFHPVMKKLEMFADGPTNPSGVDWNERGDAFVGTSGDQHLFHVAPAGQYRRDAGTWMNPYGYAQDLPGKGLPAIVDWRHDRPAHAGITIYEGHQWPKEWRGLVLLGNLDQGALNCDRLTPAGSTYKAEKERDLLGPSGNFLVSRAPFRPVSHQTGPDGALWIGDGVQRDLGRIWRVVWVGDQAGKAVPSRPSHDMNLSGVITDELSALLEHENIWHRRMGQRVLSTRHDLRVGTGIHGSSKVHKLVESKKDIRFRLAALWALHSANELEDDYIRVLDRDEDPAMRVWVARLTGERGFAFGAAMSRLARLAKDTNAAVRLAVAVAARQFVSGSLTVNTPPAISLREVITGGVLSDLHKSPIVPGDPVLPFVYWMALEPIVAFDAGGALGFLEDAKDSSLCKWPMNNYVLTRIMRRTCDLTDPAMREKHLNYAMKVLGGLAAETQLANAALDGLIAGFRDSGARPTIPLEPIFASLRANPAVADKARQLATLIEK